MWRSAEQHVAAAEWLRVWGAVPDGAPLVTDDAFLWPALRDDAPVMLKIPDPTGDEAQQGALLDAIGGHGAVRVQERAGSVYLMERIRHAGPTLCDMALSGADDAAVHVLCDVIGAMQAALAGVRPPGLIPLDMRMRFVADHAGDPRLPPDLRRLMGWAAEYCGDRVADRNGWQALHGDMHHFNALHDSARGWCAIDPKGVLGPPLYDYANLVLNPVPHAALVHDPARMGRVAAIIAERTGASRAEMLGWVAFQGCLALAWSLFDDERDYWRAGLRVAAELAGLHPPA